jgi:hypothetical protein
MRAQGRDNSCHAARVDYYAVRDLAARCTVSAGPSRERAVRARRPLSRLTLSAHWRVRLPSMRPARQLVSRHGVSETRDMMIARRSLSSLAKPACRVRVMIANSASSTRRSLSTARDQTSSRNHIADEQRYKAERSKQQKYL